MDGVAIDSCHWHYEASSKRSVERNFATMKFLLDLHHAEFNGLATRVKLKKLYDMGLIKNQNFVEIENLKQFKTVAIIHKLVQIKPENKNL
jgi:hypothetical protein